AAVPNTAEISVVQHATTRLVQAADCIWVASSRASYQRSDSPAGGKRSDCDAVNEVSSTIRLGPTRKITAMPVSAANTALSDSAPQSTVALGFCIGRQPGELVEQEHDDQHGEQEDHRDRSSKRPVVGTDRLLVDVQRHIHEACAANQRLGHEGGDAGR